MKFNKKKILEALKQLLDINVEQFSTSNSLVTPLPSGGMIHKRDRILIPLSGKKHISFGYNDKEEDIYFKPKDALICPSFTWVGEHWDSPHSMLSIGFYHSHIRIIIIDHDGITERPNGPDFFYHTNNPPHESIIFLKMALFAKTQNINTKKIIFNILIEELITLIKNEENRNFSDDMLYILKIQSFIEKNIAGNIAREDAAESIGISSSYITQLLRKHKKMGFSSFLNKIRIDYAKNLLLCSDMEIGDISSHCGYSYPSYFIKVFKDIYHTSPAQYRVDNKNRHIL